MIRYITKMTDSLVRLVAIPTHVVLATAAVASLLACNRSPEAPDMPAVPSLKPQKSVIILCTGNSCRSQMAEAFWRKYGPDWRVVSAGTRPAAEVYPLAVAALKEVGIDISAARPKGLEPFLHDRFDLVITVCDNAEKECPNFPGGGKHLHWPFDDPPKFPGDDAARLKITRRVRDEIEAKVRGYLTVSSDSRP